MNGLRNQLIYDEGRVAHAYQDSMLGRCGTCGKSNGYWTIGVGHLIDERRGGSLPDFIIDLLLDYDIEQKTAELLNRFPFMAALDKPRKAVMINMAFQLGVDGLAKFVRALAFMRTGDYGAAAIEFADSKVAREQTPLRWGRHCAQLKTGEWQ